ncbi:hydrolase, alpha/beta fold family protein, partial [Candidatus Thiomargarita nelsonii]
MNLEILSEIPSTISHKTPILFVHGAWHGAWCWKENFLPHFAKNGYQAYALSLRGHGNSPTDKKLNRLRIADYVADIEKEVNKMSQKPILIGHSMGGFVVQKYLETHPVPAAILMASLPPQGILRTSLAIFRRHPMAFLTATISF